MVLTRPKQVDAEPLKLEELPRPAVGKGEVVLRVRACGVCRTDLHIVEGELTNVALPIVPGHQVVGEVEAIGEGVTGVSIGDRLGVAWLAASCGVCAYCPTGLENLCDAPLFTGHGVDGGFAEYISARADFTYPVPAGFPDLQAAPLLCAGLIGYRALRLADVRSLEGPAKLGLYGFGASAHILIQVATARGYEVYAFTRPGDSDGQEFARSMGAIWAGGSGEEPPVKLDASIIFAPVGALIPRALGALRKGGVCVCAGIHMSPVPGFHYNVLWGERVLRSVANLTRQDGREFLQLAAEIGVETRVTEYALEEANSALRDLKEGRVRGAAVLAP